MTEGVVQSRKEEPQIFSLCLRVKMDEPDELEMGERGTNGSPHCMTN